MTVLIIRSIQLRRCPFIVIGPKEKDIEKYICILITFSFCNLF